MREATFKGVVLCKWIASPFICLISSLIQLVHISLRLPTFNAVLLIPLNLELLVNIWSFQQNCWFSLWIVGPHICYGAVCQTENNPFIHSLSEWKPILNQCQYINLQFLLFNFMCGTLLKDPNIPHSPYIFFFLLVTSSMNSSREDQTLFLFHSTMLGLLNNCILPKVLFNVFFIIDSALG